MNRREFLKNAGTLAAGLSLLGDGGRARGAASKALRPNIIYIMADDLGYGHLGCYGQKQIKTPNIDRMAAEGIRLTDHYAGSTVCAPSRSVLLTGLHSGHCYVRGNRPLPVEGNVPIPADSQTFGKVMQSVGYTTARIGKSQAVRMGKWKALAAKGKLAMHDLDKDIGETTDLAAGHREIVKRMKTIMETSHRDTPWTTWKYTGPIPKDQPTAKPKSRKNRKKRKKPAQ